MRAVSRGRAGQRASDHHARRREDRSLLLRSVLHVSPTQYACDRRSSAQYGARSNDRNPSGDAEQSGDARQDRQQDGQAGALRGNGPLSRRAVARGGDRKVTPLFPFDNTYARCLEGFYVPCEPTKVSQPVMLRFNDGLADELGLDLASPEAERLAEIFSGNEEPAGAQPIAQAYAGHQFGGFVPQLGDGRALLLGEVIDRQGNRRDIAFKGSGPTPFSRGGDGKAAVGPVLREYLIGEAMHALGIPTTRALAAVSTGEPVRRERSLPGAVLTRVGASHVRVGTFQYFAARGDTEKLRTLADYVLTRHYPSLQDRPDRYLALLESTAQRQAALLAQWMAVGFIHGVMNTDNMAVSGETIDYGPCAFMEAYNSAAVFSSIDAQGRYAYGNQPMIARWNLARLAETLLPLIDAESSDRAVAQAMEVLNAFSDVYEGRRLERFGAKLGLTTVAAGDADLVDDWLALLEQNSVDFTLAWRRLADAAAGDATALEAMFRDGAALQSWLTRWQNRVDQEGSTAAACAAAMRASNPLYIPRNHLVEEALSAASDRGDLEPFERLLDAVTRPFDERPELGNFAEPAPLTFTARYKTFCGT
ncbi:MAG: YdiU family protein [Pirellula sp.]|nr:YdiU family protein [Pirellula sp.]